MHRREDLGGLFLPLLGTADDVDAEGREELILFPRPSRFVRSIRARGRLRSFRCRLGRRFILCKPLSQPAVLLAQGVNLVLLLDARDNRVFDFLAALREPRGLLAQALLQCGDLLLEGRFLGEDVARLLLSAVHHINTLH